MGDTENKYCTFITFHGIGDTEKQIFYNVHV